MSKSRKTKYQQFQVQKSFSYRDAMQQIVFIEVWTFFDLNSIVFLGLPFCCY